MHKSGLSVSSFRRAWLASMQVREKRFCEGHQCPWGEGIVPLAGHEALHQLHYKEHQLKQLE